MHRFMRAIGFSKLTERKQQKKLVTDIIVNPDDREYTTKQNDTVITMFSKEFAPGLGISVCGEFDEDDNYSYDYFYPYLRGNVISSSEDVSIERHAEKESYAGICDDVKVGISLIFYLQNMISYIRIKNQELLPVRGTTLSLSGLSVQGMIVLPIEKDDRDRRRIRRQSAARAKWMNAARTGDEEAIEHLTTEDMDTYTALSNMIQNEKTDILSLVDTYFMPYGVECDHYSIMGEILEVEQVTNEITKEKIWKMTLLCNDIALDICINAMDLYGEPAVGRRFRGVIWLQGYINYPFQ